MQLHLRRGFVLVLGLILPVVIAACGGSVPPPDAGTTDIRPAGTGSDPEAPRVEIYTSQDRFFIDDFRVDFAKMKNIHALMGFYPDQWEKMETVPFSQIREFEIRSVADQTTFERIYQGREDFQLNPQEIFQVAVAARDGSSFDYFAILPRLRGYRDGQRWEQQMAGNTPGIRRIVIQP
jgi:hypothetical protein